MRNALAELAMRLVDAEDREEFRKADGVTAIGTLGEFYSRTSGLGIIYTLLSLI